MRRKVILSSKFRRDFSAYSENIRTYRSEVASRSFMQSVAETWEKLESTPYIGRKSDMEGIRSMQVKYDFRMYYRVSEEILELLALHSTRANPENNPFE